MIQNIKVDTIYYSTNSDFEMEFNLCGCCKMRLLTDKTDHPKEFINQLAKAVARSQVIICCGKLFDKDGLINLVSRAIKKGLTVINNSSLILLTTPKSVLLKVPYLWLILMVASVDVLLKAVRSQLFL